MKRPVVSYCRSPAAAHIVNYQQLKKGRLISRHLEMRAPREARTRQEVGEEDETTQRCATSTSGRPRAGHVRSVLSSRLHHHPPPASSNESPHLPFTAAPMDERTRGVAVAMQPSSPHHRLAVVTGGNKGIGREVCRQLAAQGVTVILTARDEKRGKDAVESLRHECNLSNIIYHPLDVLDDDSVASLAQYIESRYGKLDILVNNAGVGGVEVDLDGARALNIDPSTWLSSGAAAANLLEGVVIQTYDGAVKCLNTNYHGIRRVTEGLLPLLKQSSSGARIVNTTSLRSELKRMPNAELREELRDAGAWDEHRIGAMLEEFLDALRRQRLEEEGWPTMMPAYSVSKMAVNLYTRIMATRLPEMRVNCVHPGFVRTDINWNTGVISPAEGARGVVQLAMLTHDGPTGCYFRQTELGVAW